MPDEARLRRNLFRAVALVGAGLTIGTLAALPARAVVVMGSAPASATAGSIAMTDGVAQAMPSGTRNGSAGVTIANRGTEPDRLIALSSPSSSEVEIHAEVATGNDASATRSRAALLEIQPGQTVTLQPDGDRRLVFVGVTQPFAQGGEVSVTFTFGKAGKIALKLPVLAPTGQNADSGRRSPSRP